VLRPAFLFAVLALAGCGGDTAPQATSAADEPAGDVALLVEHVARVHPDPWRSVSEERFRAAADDLQADWPGLDADERLVGLMRLLALLGPRDGHTGMFPLDDAHDEELHLYSLRLYEFSDGLYVVAAEDEALVGARVEAIAGVPVDELREQAAPLVPHDNDASLAARIPQWLVTAEVLAGLGVLDEPGPATFTLSGREVELEPVPASAYAEAHPDLFHPIVPQGLPRMAEPAYLARRLEERWATWLEDGRTVFAAYNVTLGTTSQFAVEVLRLAQRPGIQRVILDLRHNPGGNNTTYEPLLDVLTRAQGLTVLTSRTTFSAAANLLAELERDADPVLVGEPTGGSPNLYGDPVALRLPETGLTAHVAGVYWELAPPNDERLAFEPDVPVELSSEDVFAGRDPVLTAALGRAPR
jgi:hypothetical protein